MTENKITPFIQLLIFILGLIFIYFDNKSLGMVGSLGTLLITAFIIYTIGGTDDDD